jgi:hypothetical protein
MDELADFIFYFVLEGIRAADGDAKDPLWQSPHVV